mgnify:CR=1 FL=1
MARYRYHSKSESDTEHLAKGLAEAAYPGAVIALDGDLGAGKTFFSKAFARGLGVREVVNSPTFTIIKEYKGLKLPLYHMDVYRISLEEAEELGLDEYFYGSGVCLIEWARQIDELLPEDRLHIELIRHGENERRIELSPRGHRSEQWCLTMHGKGVLS